MTRSTLYAQLRAEIFARLPLEAFSELAGKPTFGVEHEFFLLHASGNPCGHEHSQAFFHSFLSQHPLWNVKVKMISGTDLIEGLEVISPWPGAALKYEYDPHLLEINTPAFQSLQQLELFLRDMWDAVDAAAAASGIRARHTPLLTTGDTLALAGRTRIPRVRVLLNDRIRVLQSQKHEPSIAGFPAVLAATQVHVGGLNWAHDDTLIERLYSQHELLLTAAYNRITEPCATRLIRESSYSSCFGACPLVGKPRFSPWTLEMWLEALLQTPLIGTNEPWAGRTVLELSYPPRRNWALFFERVRDLQWIRPRLMGTIEFRASPAQPDPASIRQLLATVCTLVTSS